MISLPSCSFVVMLDVTSPHFHLLYLQLFISYIRCLCLFTYSGVQSTLCHVFDDFSSSWVPYVASFSGLSIFDCAFGILWRLFVNTLSYNVMTFSHSARLIHFNSSQDMNTVNWKQLLCAILAITHDKTVKKWLNLVKRR